jgi:methylthioribulose-1-phosphate dehydratase
MQLSEAAPMLIRYGTEFHRRGWVLGTSGNFSVVLERSPLRLAITASSVDKGRLAAAQILEVDHNGAVVRGAGNPSAETLLHLQIAQTMGADAVFHTHSVWSTILSDLHSADTGLVIEGYEMLKGLEGVSSHEHHEWIPILENTQDMVQLSSEIKQILGGLPHTHGLLINRHGLYTWGRNAEAAAHHVEILEFLLESVGRSYTLQQARREH